MRHHRSRRALATRVAVFGVIGVALLAIRVGVPQAEVDGSIRDFGATPQGKVLVHRFLISNRGRGVLRLTQGQLGCQCMAVIRSPAGIPAGLTGEVEVACGTSGLRGVVTRKVALTSNDPARRDIVLQMRASVVPEFRASTRVVDFGQWPAGEEAHASFTVSTGVATAATVVSAESTDPIVSVRLVPAGAGLGITEVSIIVTRKRHVRRGPHAGNIIVRTSSRYTTEIRIPVRGIVGEYDRLRMR